MSAGEWTAITVRSPGDRTAVADALFAIGAEAVQELGDDLVAHVRGVDRARARAVLRSADESASVEMSETPDVDWSTAWRNRISSHRVGRFVVTPPWLVEASRDDAIVIEPGMAFGTGEHETTRGVLELMQRFMPRDAVVADLGAGSAVLAIAAAKLGARRCIAIELDGDAISNAEHNVRVNAVADRVSVVEGDAATMLPLVAPVRVILANIVSSVVVELLPVMKSALTRDGIAILSGILLEERSRMETEVARRGWQVKDAIEAGLWWSAVIAPV